MQRILLMAMIGLNLLVVAGCSSIGPRTVARDRFDYSASISDSWKRQTLLNIVKLRYLDPPIFVDVGQIVAGYSLETSLSAGGQLSSINAVQGNSLVLGGAGRYTDRPTVTYTPLTGNKFIKSLMTPLQPSAVFFMIESGWPADAVLFSAVAAVNGLKNQDMTLAGVSPPDADFLRVLELLRQIQLSGAVSLRVQQDAQKQETTVLTLRATDISEQTLADIRELRRLLHLSQDATDFKLAFGAVAGSDREVAVLTRSLMHIMATVSAYVEIPAEDVTQGRAAPGASAGPVRICCAKDRPADAFVAVRYREHWFWIDDCDLKTKRTFSFMMMLFTLAETGEREPLPLITIPAQ